MIADAQDDVLSRYQTSESGHSGKHPTKAPSAELRPDQTAKCWTRSGAAHHGNGEEIVRRDMTRKRYAGYSGYPKCGVQTKTGCSGAEGDVARFRNRVANANCRGE